MKAPLLKTTFKKQGKIALFSLLLLLSASSLWWRYVPSPYEATVNFSTSSALFDKDGQLFHVRLSQTSEYCIPIPLHAMGKWLPLLAVMVEDKRFYSHIGVDFLALGRAIYQNTSQGKTVSGASTLTTQLVRISSPRSRTIYTKALEFTQAIKLEQKLTKSQILELYLNRAPMGGTFRGVEAAARGYFGKSAAQLTISESALLIGMLKGPTYYRPDISPSRSKARRNEVLEEAEKRGLLDKQGLARAKSELLPKVKATLPMEAWHFAENAITASSFFPDTNKSMAHAPFLGKNTARMHQNSQTAWANKNLPKSTTLKRQHQLLLEKSLEKVLVTFPDHVTAAGVIVDNTHAEVSAYVGNARFNPLKGTHWVDCGTAPRSPGSTLKPFIFGEAFAQGTLVPLSLLADSPLAFSGNAPRNFDRRYRGPISAQKALVFSLNAPAVRVLRIITPETALHTLHRYGFSYLTKDASHYADSLALGGCEVTLLEIAKGYAALANQGRLQNLKIITAQEADSYPPTDVHEKNDVIGTPILPAAAYLTITSLDDPQGLPSHYADLFKKKKIHAAVKTGTSYGLRDAWAVACTPQYTVVIWLGNPEGKPHQNLIGGTSALPTALYVIDGLSSTPTPFWKKPLDIELYQACKLSGKPATPFCKDTLEGERIKGVSHSVPCEVHRPEATVFPADLAEYAKSRAHKSDTRKRIEIVSPKKNVVYKINALAPEQKILLKAEGTKGVVYWFVNKVFFGEQQEETPLLWPISTGDITLSVIDETGRSASTFFSVISANKKSLLPLRLEEVDKNENSLKSQ